MFTTVTDHALARWELSDGTTIAVGYDEYAGNPLEMYGTTSVGIVRDERNALAFDPTGVLEDYDHYQDMVGDGSYILSMYGMTLEAFNDAVDDESIDPDYFELSAIDDYVSALEELEDIVYLEWEDTKEYGRQIYRIAYRPSVMIAQGWHEDRLDESVIGMAREYSAWVNGSVYLVGIETPDGDTEYTSLYAGSDYDDEDAIKDIVLDIHGNVDGFTRV